MLLGAAVANAFADFFKRLGHNGVDAVAGGEVRLDLRVAPGGFELGDQVGGTDNVLAQAAQQVDRAAIDQRNCEHAIVRGVLHGKIAMPRQDGFELVE